MSGQHTPGPWFLYTVPTSVGSCHKIGPFPSARTSNTDPTYACVYADGVRIGIDDSLPRAMELTANARLISAAPELLDALKGYMDAVNTMNAAMYDGLNVHGAISGLIGAEDNAKAAIAKASPTTTDAGVAG